MPKQPYKVGENIQINLNNRFYDAVITAVVERTDGLRLQVPLGTTRLGAGIQRQ